MGAMIVWSAVLAVAMGCAPHTSIESTGPTGRAEKLSKVFVLSHVGSAGEVSADRFERKLVQTAKVCGVTIEVAHVSKLDVAPEIHLERLKQFEPRHVLTLRQAGGITGAVHWEYYDARLFEMPQTPIWRADVHLNRDGTLFGDPGEVLAMDLLRKMSQDRLIAPCAELVDPYAAPENAKKETYRRR